MWEDIIKVQISQARQKLRSDNNPLPDDDDEDCFQKFEYLVRQFQKMGHYIDPNKTLLYDLEYRDLLTPEQWCEFLETLTFTSSSTDGGRNYFVALSGKVTYRGTSRGELLPPTKKDVTLYFICELELRNNRCNLEVEMVTPDGYMPNIFTMIFEAEEGFGSAGQSYDKQMLFDWWRNVARFAHELKEFEESIMTLYPKKLNSGADRFFSFVQLHRGMLFDFKKSQIQVGRQKLRTDDAPLPDEEDDKDCEQLWREAVDEIKNWIQNYDDDKWYTQTAFEEQRGQGQSICYMAKHNSNVGFEVNLRFYHYLDTQYPSSNEWFCKLLETSAFYDFRHGQHIIDGGGIKTKIGDSYGHSISWFIALGQVGKTRGFRTGLVRFCEELEDFARGVIERKRREL
jgi:hypothetical protein